MTLPEPWDIRRLRMSVGYGRQKTGRHYSPVEVGEWLAEQRERGESLADCATTLDLNGTGHIGRFSRLLRLPEEVRHLVAWGSPKGAIGFSAAVELTKLQNARDQKAVADAVLEHGLTSREIRQIAQLKRRSEVTVSTAIEAGLRMRPTVVRNHVLLGSVSEGLHNRLATWVQADRDALLDRSIRRVGLPGTTGRLGKRIFTLVGRDDFGSSIREIGADELEVKLVRAMEEEVLSERNEG